MSLMSSLRTLHQALSAPDFFLVFSTPRSLTGLRFTFRSLIYVELINWCIGCEIEIIVYSFGLQCPVAPASFVEKVILFQANGFAPWSKINWCVCVGLFLGSLLCSIECICPFVHTILS